MNMNQLEEALFDRTKSVSLRCCAGIQRLYTNLTDIGSGLIGAVFHLLLLIALAVISLAKSQTAVDSVPNADFGEEVPEVAETIRTEQPKTPLEVGGLLAPLSIGTPGGIADSAENAVTHVQPDTPESRPNETLPVRSVAALSRDALNSPLGLKAIRLRQELIQQQSRYRGSTSLSEAVSGLGGDILRKLQDGDLLIVWMFDASLSMWSDRQKAAEQIGEVFTEIANRIQGKAYRAQHSLIAFAEGSEQGHPPTEKWTGLVRLIPQIQNDWSGKENVFSALQHAIPEYRKTWKKQLLFVVWTNESGDDIEQLEDTITLCQRENVSISVVGPTAVLGRRRGSQLFNSPKLHPYRGYLPVDKGPDAGVPQLVQIPHWYGGIRANFMPSGFGPYHLVRLASATGGTYTHYDRWEDRTQYTVEDFPDYLPDYRAAHVIHREASASPLRRAVMEAAKITVPAAKLPPPLFDPNYESEFHYWLPPDEYHSLFRGIVEHDLKNVRQAIPLIEKAYAILSNDRLDSALEQEKSLRWKASYLLARGRLAAMSVRHREYEILATNLLAGRVFRADSNMAEIVASSKLRSGSKGEARRKEAWTYLDRCWKEHPNTPWAELARFERAKDLGFQLNQRFMRSRGVGGPGPPGKIAGPSI